MTITNKNKLLELSTKYRRDVIFREYVDNIMCVEKRFSGTIEEVWEAAFLAAYFRKRPELWFKNRDNALHKNKKEFYGKRKNDNA